MDELQISGKRFISSRRIARDNSYTPDYIGQLIRGGKVIGQKVGRAWYVDEVSFNAFLGTEKAPADLADQKSSDLPSAPQAVAAGQTFARQDLPAFEPIKIVEPHYVPLNIIRKEAPAEAPPAGLRYYGDDRPSLPEIREIQVENNEPWVPYPAEEIKSISNDIFAPHIDRRVRPMHIAGLAVLGVSVLIFTAAISSLISLNLSVGEGNTASAFYSLHW